MADVNRRDFVKTAVGTGVAFGFLNAARPANARVVGANDRINLGFIGVGGRGYSLLHEFTDIAKADGKLQVLAVCDVYEKRKRRAADFAKCAGCLDCREIIHNKEIDGIVIATPDHWHAPIAIEAMNAGEERLPGKAHDAHHRRGPPRL